MRADEARGGEGGKDEEGPGRIILCVSERSRRYLHAVGKIDFSRVVEVERGRRD